MDSEQDTPTGTRVLVVGASSGIGKHLACSLARDGYQVVASGRRAARLAELPGVIPIACDVTSAEQVDRLVDQAAEQMGGIDALVYASGVTRITPLQTASDAQWVELFDTNLFGAARLTRAALPHLLAPGSQARAVYLSSDAIERPFPAMVLYSTSKAALRAFAQGLAHELPSLKVTEVMVGPTGGTEIGDHFDTDLLEEWLPRWFEEGYVHTELLDPADVTAVIRGVLDADAPSGRVDALGAEGHQNLEQVRLEHADATGRA